MTEYTEFMELGEQRVLMSGKWLQFFNFLIILHLNNTISKSKYFMPLKKPGH